MTKEQDALQAIKTLRDYLQSEFISDSCHDAPMFGCASCQAIALERELESLAAALDDAKIGCVES